MPRKYSIRFAFFCLLLFSSSVYSNIVSAQGQKPAQVKTIMVKTEPKAIIWLDEIRRGVSDENGRFELKKVTNKRHSLRARAKGFKESTIVLAPPLRSEILVKLTQTTDEAELLFQQAEEERDKARTVEAKEAVVALYRRALKLRPRFAEARLGLARALSSLDDYETALDEIDAARKYRRGYAEASAVEGRIYRSMGDEANAIKSFQRAIREARGFQPEAHTGLAFIFEENAQYEDAVAELKTALDQLSDTEPILYSKLGEYYEKLEKYKEAIEAYEKFLKIAPDNNLAPAIRSIVEQLRRKDQDQ